jgi:uncharacterized membrane protein
MDHPAAFIERYRKWSYEMRDAFRDLSSERDYRYWFDPFWVRAQPYRVSLKSGGSGGIELHLRNFNQKASRYEIKVDAPLGISAEKSSFAIRLAKDSKATFPIQLRSNPDAEPGVHVVAFDVTVDGRRFGERFDCIVNVEK